MRPHQPQHEAPVLTLLERPILYRHHNDTEATPQQLFSDVATYQDAAALTGSVRVLILEGYHPCELSEFLRTVRPVQPNVQRGAVTERDDAGLVGVATERQAHHHLVDVLDDVVVEVEARDAAARIQHEHDVGTCRWGNDVML